MQGCFLRMSVDAEAVGTCLEAGKAFALERIRRADWVSPGRRAGVETLRASISTADGDDLEGQITAAAAFLEAHGSAIRVLSERPDVVSCFLDFMWSLPNGSPGRWGRLPRPLIERCAASGVEIEVSVFAAPATGSARGTAATAPPG